MSWQFTKWYAAHRVPRDKWDHITLIVFVAAVILILGRYPLHIILAVSSPFAVLLGWLRYRKIKKMMGHGSIR
jgi:uncharacterized membrane protein